ncbi:hypothetical protein CEXT_236381 [Caerostris extrusa]|uniref:Uncharacterized protein n=1 Tax=Caerostris extrusa TaxID=172846 RepID=A0AAV4RZW0_CAEEX|nr:hypothetical protein CEXT_236381 [Caerostris extrusa]
MISERETKLFSAGTGNKRNREEFLADANRQKKRRPSSDSEINSDNVLTIVINAIPSARKAADAVFNGVTRERHLSRCQRPLFADPQTRSRKETMESVLMKGELMSGSTWQLKHLGSYGDSCEIVYRRGREIGE